MGHFVLELWFDFVFSPFPKTSQGLVLRNLRAVRDTFFRRSIQLLRFSASSAANSNSQSFAIVTGLVFNRGGFLTP